MVSNDIIVNKNIFNISVCSIINGKRNAAEISKTNFDEKNNVFYFNRLIVHQTLRNQGIANTLMTKLIQILDQEKIILECDVNPYGDLNFDKLISFYKKFGFVDNKHNGCDLIYRFKTL